VPALFTCLLLAATASAAPHMTPVLIWYLDYGGETVRFPTGQIRMNNSGVLGLTMDATASRENWLNQSADLKKAVIDPPEYVTWFLRPTSDWDLCNQTNNTVREVLTNFKLKVENYLAMVACEGECKWGLGIAAEDDKQWTCNGTIVPASDFRYILFGGYRSVYPEDDRLLLDIQGGGDQGYPMLDPDTPAHMVLQNGCPPLRSDCVYPSYHLLEGTYEPYSLQGGTDPHACKNMKLGDPLKCCDGNTVCKNEAGLPCAMQDASGFSILMETVVDEAKSLQQDPQVLLIPCVGASASNADCKLANDSMLSSSLARLPPNSPVCFYMGGV